MRIRHLRCGTMCPRFRPIINGDGRWSEAGIMVCHVLLLETDDGLALVDAGFGEDDVRDPKRRLGGAFMAGVRPQLNLADTAKAQVEALGYSADDVRHVVPTHFDLDHIGGLSDFPKAKVHVYELEHHAATKRPTFHERQRYRTAQFDHDVQWEVYPLQGESWFGFETVRGLRGLGDDVLLVPLTGHSRGHVGVAARGDMGWILHAGDAYFDRREVHETGPVPAGLRFFQRVVAYDDVARRSNQDRLRELAARHGDEVRVVSAHDEQELRACARA